MEESVGSAMIKLTDQNWVTWKPRMEGILYCKDLHEAIEGDEAKPEEMTEKQWYIQNRKAIGTIIQWVDDSVFRHVAQETNAHKLWTKLELMFEKKAVTKKFFLIKDLVNMKYKEEMSMTEHLNNFQNIINQLATMGMVLENELQALLLLSSFPDGWETFVVTVSDSAASGVLSVDFVKDSMHNEETRKKNSDKNIDLCFPPKNEQEEKEDKRRYKARAHLFTIIKVARDEDLKEQIGKDIYFDLVDHDKVRSFRIQEQTPFNLFKEEVAREFGIPVQFQRFWIWAKRQNHTYRPKRPLTPHEEARTVGALREVSNKAHNAELKLFLEVDRGQDLHPVPPPDKNREDILLFFKLYDPEKEEFRYVGSFFVKSYRKPKGILIKLNELAGFAPDEKIELFEEIKFEPTVMCVRLRRRASFRFNEIEDGDIIWFQKKLLPEGEEKFRYPDVPSFLEYVKNRQSNVHVRGILKVASMSMDAVLWEHGHVTHMIDVTP